MFTAGGWLSTVIVVTVSVPTLPAQSVAVAFTSYWPSATASGPVFVFHVAGTTVQVLVPCGATRQTTAGLGSASGVEAARVTVPEMPVLESGFVIVTAGAVLSTRTFEIAVEVATFPALSWATTWRS